MDRLFNLKKIRSSKVFSRFAHGAFWSLIGAVLSRGFGLFATFIMARTLGKENYGKLGIIRSTLEMFGVLAGFGLGMLTTKYVAEFKKDNPTRASRIICLSAIVSWLTGIVAFVIILAFAPILSTKTFGNSALTNELRLGSALVLVGAINGAQTGALSGFEAFKVLMRISVWTGLANFPCVVIGCLSFGLNGALVGLITSQIIGCVLNKVALNHESRKYNILLWDSKWFHELRLLWEFSIPAVLASSMVAPVYWYCQTLLLDIPDGLQHAADYSIGAQWRMLVQYFPYILCTAYLPVASSIATTDFKRRMKLMAAGIAIASCATAIMMSGILILAPWILAAYGKAFLSADRVLTWMLITAIFDSINGIIVQTLMASGKAWIRLISNCVWAILVIYFAIIFIPKYGALGLAWSLCIAQAIHLIVQVVISYYVLRRST